MVLNLKRHLLFFDFYTRCLGYIPSDWMKDFMPLKKETQTNNAADKSDLFFSGLNGCLSFRES